MKAQKNILSVLVVLLLSAAPELVHALSVTITGTTSAGTRKVYCGPLATAPTDTVAGPATCKPALDSGAPIGVTRTVVKLQDVDLRIPANSTTAFKPFVATLATCPTGSTTCTPGTALFPRIMVEQSGSNARALFDNTTIKAPPRSTGVLSSADCSLNTCPPCPCSVTIQADSDTTDFPALVTNFNNSVIMSGVIKKGSAAESGASTAFTLAPKGDNYSATGFAQGIVMNGTGAGTGVSLPNKQTGFVLPSGPTQLCAGNLNCVFKVGSNVNTSFSDSISQSITCINCRPLIKTTYRFGFRFPGDKVAVPGGSLSGDLFALGLPVPFDAFSCSAVTITKGSNQTPNDDNFSVKCDFRIGADSDGIQPLGEEVALTLGSYSTTILPGSCHQSPNGASECDVNIDGEDLHVVINQNSPVDFGINANGKNVDLSATANNPVQFTLQIGNDNGSIPDPGVIATIK